MANTGDENSESTHEVEAEDLVGLAVRAVLAAQRQIGGSTTPRFRNDELAALLPEFSGHQDNVCNWIQRVDAIQATYGVPNEIIQLIAMGKLTGNARTWYHSKPDYITMDWPMLKIEIQTMFDSRPNKIVLLKSMEARRWKKSEKFSTYFTDKVMMCNQIGLPDDEIIEYVIDGFSDPHLQSQARMKGFTSLAEVLSTMKSVTSEDRSTFVPRTYHHPRTTTQASSGDSRPERPSPVRCFNCSLTGHKATECTRPKRTPGSCFECGSMQHQLRDCPRKRRPEHPPADSTTHLVSPTTLTPACRTVVKMRPLPGNLKFEVNAFLDLGSPVSFIKEDYVPCYVTLAETNDSFTGMNGSGLRILGCYEAEIDVDQITSLLTKFYVIPTSAMSDSCLLGRDVLCNPTVNFTINQGKVYLKFLDNDVHYVENEVLNIQVDQFEETRINLNLNINPQLSNEVRATIEQNLFENYVTAPRPEFPITDLQMKLLIDPKHVPFYFHPRRLSYSDKLEVDKITKDLLDRKIIRKSSSQYSSPIVLVKKKSGKLRLCVDFRELNKLTARDNFPMPLIDDQIEQLRDKQYFSRLDLKDAFHHVTIDPESIKYTSFVTPSGQFEYLKMPFGLKNSPAVFMRFVNTAFQNMIEQGKIIIYIDDILIATKTLQKYSRFFQFTTIH